MIWDILVIATILISAILAFFRGFVREVLTIAGVVGGVAAAYYGGPSAKPVFRDLFGVSGDGATDKEKEAKLFDLIPYELIADGLAYGLIFLVVVILLSVISHYLSGFTKKFGMGVLDRTLGVAFGVFRGILLLGLLYLPVHIYSTAEEKKDWFKDSRTMVYVELTSDALLPLFPDPEQEPEKMFSVKDVKKAIEARSLMDKAVPESPQSETHNEDSEQTAGEGYDQELREKMKGLLQDSPTEQPSGE